MAQIRHIALTTKDPAKVAEFYKEAFDMQELRRGDSGVFLTDGYINLAILNWKTEADADVGANGPNYNGIHHFGFMVDDIEAHGEKLEKAGGTRLTRTAAPGTGGLFGMSRGPTGNAEVKFSGPDGVILDISQSGWQVSP
jgi:methylmalonyl-CoA/ethylmalonyl-CoA epimerase